MPTDPESLYAKAYSTHYQARDLCNAIAMYREILRVYPRTDWANYAQGEISKIESDPSYLADPETQRSLQALDEAKQQRLEDLGRLHASESLTIKAMLAGYLGQEIGINAFDPSKVQAATLAEVQGDYFAVESDGIRVTIPYTQIIKVLNAPTGDVKLSFFGGAFPLVISVFDLVIYKGAIGVGMSTSF